MIADRRKALTDDLLSELIRTEERGDRLDAGEVRMLAFSILLAGTDTTRTQLGASMQVLCEHPGQWALLRERPELGMNAVEETMRHSPSMCSTLRSVTDDVTVGDYMFPAGTFIVVNTYAANRDSSIYDDPTHFDITRNDPPPILTFGGGRTTASARTSPSGNCPKRSRFLPTACRIRGAPKPRRGDHFSA
jgi:cytochrome P450